MTARVRIELTTAVWTEAATGDWRSGVEEVRIWLSDDAGNLNGTRKPAATLLGESRPELLERIAAWMRGSDDPGLSKMAGMYEAMREPG